MLPNYMCCLNKVYANQHHHDDMLSHVKPVPHWYRKYYEWINADPNLLDHDQETKHDKKITEQLTTSPVNNGKPASDIYHVLIESSHLTKDPTQQIEKLRIVGTYDTLPLARAAGYRALFDAGYEAEFFKSYGVSNTFFDEHKVAPDTQDGLLVYAVAQDGTIFQVRLLITPNDEHWTHEFEDGRVCKTLYYVVETTSNYNDGAEGEAVRSHAIKGVFEDYEKARTLALRALLKDPNVGKEKFGEYQIMANGAGIIKKNFAQYEEVQDGERDCGYGENVLVHAVGQDGRNYSVSVIQGSVLESVRLMEASMRIR